MTTEPLARPAVDPASISASTVRAPNASGVQLPPMPSGLSAVRRWVQTAMDLYSRGLIRSGELAEARQSAAAIANLHRTAAELTRAKAAMRAARAQERLAEVLASIEHGGAAVMLLARLQESLTDGRRRPLPGRVHALSPTPQEPA